MASRAAHVVVDNHPELFDGRHRGGQRGRRLQRHRADGRWRRTRAYLVQTAEKGILWLRLIAHGRAGHGSQCQPRQRRRRASPRRSAGSTRTSGRASTSPPCARCSTAWPSSPAPRWSDEDPDELLDHLGSGPGLRARDAAGHRQLHDGRRRVQAQRHPAERRPPRSTAASCPATTTTCSPPSASSPASTSRSRSCTGTSRSTHPSRGPSSRP